MVPVTDSERRDGEFERYDDSPLEDVVPAHGKTPRGVDEASRVRVETTRDRIHDSELTKGVHDVEHHDTDDEEIDEQGGRATVGKGLAGTDEETSTDRTTDGDHVQMASLHGSLELLDVDVGLTPLEGAEVETIAGHEVLLVAIRGNDGAGTMVEGGERLLGGSAHGAFLFGRHAGWLCWCVSQSVQMGGEEKRKWEGNGRGRVGVKVGEGGTGKTGTGPKS